MIPKFASACTSQPSPRSSATVATEPPFAPPAPASAAVRTVLVVDDDPAIRNLVALAAECAGHRTFVASNGLEAIESIEQHPEVDLVILDLLMPVMNGRDTLRTIRTVCPGLPVVMLSGFDAETIQENLGETIPDGFLQKPFTLDKFNRVLAVVRN